MSGAGFSKQYDEAGRIEGQPIPMRPAIPEPGVYPIEALSRRLKDATLAMIDKHQVPSAIAAQSVLAAAALGTQAYIDVELPTGEVIPTSLFYITVAESGERKSSVDKLALHPIRERERVMEDEYRKQEGSWNCDHAAWVAARKKAQAGDKSRAQIAAQLEACGEEPQAPAQPMLVSDEGTIEGLVKLFAVAMPFLGLFSDEGGQWLGGHSMQDEKRVQTGAALSKLWDGATIKRVRAGDGFTILRGRRLSMHLMIQPRIARALFSDKDLASQGLLSRLLISHPTSTKGDRPWRDPDQSSNLALEKYGARLYHMLGADVPMDPVTRALNPRRIKLSPEAVALWIKWHDAVEAELGKGKSLAPISGFAAKLPEHSVRIAAVMAYFEDRDISELSATALAAGIKIAKFHANEALRLYGVAPVDQETEKAAELIEWIREQGHNIIGQRWLSRYGPGRGMDGPALKRAIALLVDMKHLVPIAGGAPMAGSPKHYREAYTVITDEAEETPVAIAAAAE